MSKYEIRECLTFDDVLLSPQKSDVLPNQVDLSTYLTKKIAGREKDMIDNKVLERLNNINVKIYRTDER